MDNTPAPAERYSRLDKLAIAIATFFGVGYIPIIPATWGSAATVAAFVVFREVYARIIPATSRTTGDLFSLAVSASVVFFLIGLFLIAVWSATRVVAITGNKDPRIVVIDEVVGQLVTFLFVPFDSGLWVLAAGFFLFRFFDIWKPFPARQLESLPTGLGVVADDIMAGFYAAASLSFIYLIARIIF